MKRRSVSRKICFFSPCRFGDWCQVLRSNWISRHQTLFLDLKYSLLLMIEIITPWMILNEILLHLLCLAHCVWGIGRQRVSMHVSSLEYMLVLTDELRLLCVVQTLSFCVLNQNTGLIIWWYYVLTLFTLQPGLSALRKWNRTHADLALYTPKPFLILSICRDRCEEHCIT